MIDIKKPDYALVQFFDIKSVIKAIKAADGELIGGQRVCLKFGLSVATKCVWVDGVAAEVSENSLQKEFSQFGRIQNLIIDRSRGHALVYFDQVCVICSVYTTTNNKKKHLLPTKDSLVLVNKCQHFEGKTFVGVWIRGHQFCWS